MVTIAPAAAAATDATTIIEMLRSPTTRFWILLRRSYFSRASSHFCLCRIVETSRLGIENVLQESKGCQDHKMLMPRLSSSCFIGSFVIEMIQTSDETKSWSYLHYSSYYSLCDGHIPLRWALKMNPYVMLVGWWRAIASSRSSSIEQCDVAVDLVWRRFSLWKHRTQHGVWARFRFDRIFLFLQAGN